jgi:hypothetical protein
VAIFTNTLSSAQIAPLYTSATNTPSQTPPVFRSINQVGDSVFLSWSSISGRMYQIQFKTYLTQSNWNNLTSLPATNSTMTISDVIGSGSQRYYRAVLLP